jgi:hypothetical protein
MAPTRAARLRIMLVCVCPVRCLPANFYRHTQRASAHTHTHTNIHPPPPHTPNTHMGLRQVKKMADRRQGDRRRIVSLCASSRKHDPLHAHAEQHRCRQSGNEALREYLSLSHTHTNTASQPASQPARQTYTHTHTHTHHTQAPCA